MHYWLALFPSEISTIWEYQFTLIWFDVACTFWRIDQKERRNSDYGVKAISGRLPYKMMIYYDWKSFNSLSYLCPYGMSLYSIYNQYNKYIEVKVSLLDNDFYADIYSGRDGDDGGHKDDDIGDDFWWW